MATKRRELHPIDAYLAGLENPAAKKTLGALRMQLRKLLPGAVETISYRMPAFKVDGNAVAGFAFFKNHCGYYPFSGGVVPALKEQLDGYTTSKSGVTFPPDKPLPAKLVKTLVQARLAEIAARGKKPSAAKKAATKKAAAKKALVTDRVTDSAVKEATGRDWKGWMRALDAAGAGELNHKQLVAHLAREVESTWWRQSIAVAYEQARGKRVVGETAATGRGPGGEARAAHPHDLAARRMEETRDAATHPGTEGTRRLPPRAHGEAAGREGPRGDARALVPGARRPRGEVSPSGRAVRYVAPRCGPSLPGYSASSFSGSASRMLNPIITSTMSMADCLPFQVFDCHMANHSLPTTMKPKKKRTSPTV